MKLEKLPNGLEVGYQSRHELRHFYEDIFEKEVYVSHGITLRDGACIFDIGGNIGLFTIFIQQRWPDTRVFTFEPAPPLFEILRFNAGRYAPNAVLNDIGLADRPGEATFTFYPESSGMSSFHAELQEERDVLKAILVNEAEKGIEGAREVLPYLDDYLEERLRCRRFTCALDTLSGVIRKNGIERIDLAKIDVQKSELQVLQGLDEKDWLKLDQLVVEVHDSKGRVDHVSTLLEERGYRVTVEQDEVYVGSNIFNLYAIHERLTAGTRARISVPGTLEKEEEALEGVAIIGMSGRFPGGRDLEEFWETLARGADGVRSYSEEDLQGAGVGPETLGSRQYVKAGGHVGEVDMFDADYFSLSAQEARLLDPHHRLFLEHASTALEDAGYVPESYRGAIGVYGGMGTTNYLFRQLPAAAVNDSPEDLLKLRLYSDKDFLTSFAAYQLGLTGPAVTVQTACSTSLVAVNLACQALLNYQCDMALAGAVSVGDPEPHGYFARAGLYSPQGRCRPFDADADGTVPGQGVGLVVLKRLGDALADGDGIRAVIRGFAMNHNGQANGGYLASSVEAQAEVVSLAQAMAGVDPESIGYVEGHGLGVALMDRAELAALTMAFEGARGHRGRCAVGSVKSNIGHLEAAGGIAGLIKTVLALQYGQLPPSLHCQRPLSELSTRESPFYVNTQLSPWPGERAPRRAGVSAFAFGGVNAHLVLEQAPASRSSDHSRPCELVLLSARSGSALEEVTDRLTRCLERVGAAELADVAYTLQVGRRAHTYRRMLICKDLVDARTALRDRDPRRVMSGEVSVERSVAFLFPGLGSHHAGMAKELYRTESFFRKQLDDCCEALRPHLGGDLREVLYPGRSASADEAPEASRLDLKSMVRPDAAGDERIRRTEWAQPVQFAVEYALARQWMEWGIRPQAMLGYSIGEYVAACLAGVLSLSDALVVVARRAQMIAELPGGAMLAIPAPEDEVRRLLGARLSIAAVNGPAAVVVAGPDEDVGDLERRLEERGAVGRRLPTSHAFHSKMMNPLRQRFAKLLKEVELRPPEIAFISNVSGTWITAEQATDPNYWARHLCEPVQFGDGVSELWKRPGRLLLEVGPGQNLGSLALQHPASRDLMDAVVLASLPNSYDRQSDTALILESLGKLWLAGVEIDWQAFQAGHRRRRLSLPAYPFEKKRYWLDSEVAEANPKRSRGEPGASRDASNSRPAGSRTHPRPRLRNAYVEPRGRVEEQVARIWCELLGLEQVGAHDNFFELGGDSVVKIQFLSRAGKEGIALTPRQVFGLQTVAEVAAVVGAAEYTLADQGPVVGEAPLTPIQQRFFDKGLSEPHHWNQAIFLEVVQELARPWTRRAAEQVWWHHDALRLRFEGEDSLRRQVFCDPSESAAPWSEIDLSALPEKLRSPAIEASVALLQGAFDLSSGPLFRAVSFDLGAGLSSRLLLLAHHLSVDAVSWRILVEDLGTIYAQLERRERPSLPPKTTSLRDWALRLRDYARDPVLEADLDHWLEDRWRKSVALPLDLPGGVNRTESARAVSMELDPDETRLLLQEIPKAFGARIEEVLHLPLIQAFHGWIGAGSLLVSSAAHGRDPIFPDVDLSRTVGWFSTVFPVSLDLGTAGDSLEEALESLRSQYRASMRRGVGYGVLRYLSESESRGAELRSLPQPQVSFVYLGQTDQPLGECSLFRAAPEKSGSWRSPRALRWFELDFTALVRAQRLKVDLTYSCNLHHRATAERVLERYRESLGDIIAYCMQHEAV